MITSILVVMSSALVITVMSSSSVFISHNFFNVMHKFTRSNRLQSGNVFAASEIKHNQTSEHYCKHLKMDFNHQHWPKMSSGPLDYTALNSEFVILNEIYFC